VSTLATRPLQRVVLVVVVVVVVVGEGLYLEYIPKWHLHHQLYGH
jgi:hypothetical protein